MTLVTRNGKPLDESAMKLYEKYPIGSIVKAGTASDPWQVIDPKDAPYDYNDYLYVSNVESYRVTGFNSMHNISLVELHSGLECAVCEKDTARSDDYLCPDCRLAIGLA